MQTVTTVAAVRECVSAWRAAGRRIALVPTMGNLLSAARSRADHVVASVFVNPLQFGPNEDFSRYPRSLAQDERLLAEAHCDVLFAPQVIQIYPEGDQPTRVHVRGLSETLCGQLRPGHFDGVATVVAKLFGIIGADVAVFGEKDYQQLLVIQRMTVDLALPIQIVGAPTVRAADGLALSSRNRYLTGEERSRAGAIYQALREAVEAIAAGDGDYRELERRGSAALARSGMRVDYFAVRDAADLAEPGSASAELAVLTAAWLGRSRLIDNLRVHRPRLRTQAAVVTDTVSDA